jgi:hypothetical protein
VVYVNTVTNHLVPSVRSEVAKSMGVIRGDTHVQVDPRAPITFCAFHQLRLVRDISAHQGRSLGPSSSQKELRFDVVMNTNKREILQQRHVSRKNEAVDVDD